MQILKGLYKKGGEFGLVHSRISSVVETKILSKNGNMFFGSALIKDGGYVYIYGASEDWSKGMSGRSMIVARVRPDKITDFEQWRFFCDGAWGADLADISGLFQGTATE